MSQQVTITSVTANTPVNIYYCDSLSASCVFVSSVATFPFVFDVPAPYDEQNFVIKIEDTSGFEDYKTIDITPTSTSQPTTTPTNTPSQTPTQTPTNTPSNTTTPSQTGTPTQTPSTSIEVYPPIQPSPNVVQHPVGQSVVCEAANACDDTLTTRVLYNYEADASVQPVIGITIYSAYFSSALYDPYNGNNEWILMSWINGTYAVQITPQGTIKSFVLCQENPTPSPTKTPTSTPTNTPTKTSTPTNTQTSTQTPTPSVTKGLTPTATETPTQTPTQTPTGTPTQTQTQTQTPTQTQTQTQTPTQTATPSTTATIGSSPTPTETPSQTPTQTPTTTTTLTATPTQTPTTTTTLTATPTQTPSNTETPTQTPTPSTTPICCNCFALTNEGDPTNTNTTNYTDCDGNPQSIINKIQFATATYFCAVPGSITTSGGLTVLQVPDDLLTCGGSCQPCPTPTQTPSQTETQTQTPTPSPTRNTGCYSLTNDGDPTGINLTTYTDCDGNPQSIVNKAFESGATYFCALPGSITVGPNLTVIMVDDNLGTCGYSCEGCT